MEKRNIQISLEKAKEWYNGEDSSLKELALQAFNMNELEEPKLPKTWEEYSYSTLAISRDCLSKKFQSYSVDIDILTRLLILRDAYRQGWKPDWDKAIPKYCIFIDTKGTFVVDEVYGIRQLFSFSTEKLAEQFLDNFKEELEQLKDLL